MKNNIQGLSITGTLVFLKSVDPRTIDGKIIPGFQKLQVSVVNVDGYSVFDIKDLHFIVNKELLQKSVTFLISVASFGGNTYYKLLEVVE